MVDTAVFIVYKTTHCNSHETNVTLMKLLMFHLFCVAYFCKVLVIFDYALQQDPKLQAQKSTQRLINPSERATTFEHTKLHKCGIYCTAVALDCTVCFRCLCSSVHPPVSFSAAELPIKRPVKEIIQFIWE